MDRRARPRRHVGVPGRVDDPARQDRLTTGLGLGDDADDRVAVHQRCDELAVQHRVDARLLDQSVGDQLEALGVEFVGQRLALGHRCAHLFGALLELPSDAAGVHRLLAAVPGEALDADRSDVSPKQPNRSTRATRTPARDAARAAARPPGPDPTTSTSVSWMTSISRLGSVTVRGRAGMVRNLAVEHVSIGAPEGTGGQGIGASDQCGLAGLSVPLRRVCGMSERRFRRSPGGVVSAGAACGVVPDVSAPGAGSPGSCPLRLLLSRSPASAVGEIVATEVMPDHVHVFVRVGSTDAAGSVVRAFKGRTSRGLRAEFPMPGAVRQSVVVAVVFRRLGRVCL